MEKKGNNQILWIPFYVNKNTTLWELAMLSHIDFGIKIYKKEAGANSKKKKSDFTRKFSLPKVVTETFLQTQLKIGRK